MLHGMFCLWFQAGEYDFQYGVQYAWILIVFNMVMTFSLTTPLILPIGEFRCM